MMRHSNPGFRICDRKGFHVTFENGWTVSVQFGRGNYSSNYNHGPSQPSPPGCAPFSAGSRK